MTTPANASNLEGRSPASLGVVFLTLFIDLVGFSILFPLVAEMMQYYQQTDIGLMAWSLNLVDGLMPGAEGLEPVALTLVAVPCLAVLLMGLFAVLQFIPHRFGAALATGLVADQCCLVP